MKTDFFDFFNLAQAEEQKRSGGGHTLKFRPRGAKFHELVEVTATEEPDGSIPGWSVMIANSMIADPINRVFASDIAKSFLFFRGPRGGPGSRWADGGGDLVSPHERAPRSAIARRARRRDGAGDAVPRIHDVRWRIPRLFRAPGRRHAAAGSCCGGGWPVSPDFGGAVVPNYSAGLLDASALSPASCASETLPMVQIRGAAVSEIRLFAAA